MIHIDFWNLDQIFQIHVLQCNAMTDVWIFLKFVQHTEIVAVNNAFNFGEDPQLFLDLGLIILDCVCSFK